MSTTPGVEVKTTCDQCGECGLKNLQGLLKGASPTDLRNGNPHALEGVWSYGHPDSSKAYQGFGSECTPGGNCGREVVGRLFTRTTEVNNMVVSAIENRAKELGLQIVATGSVFARNFTK